VLVPGKHFQPGLTFEGKAVAVAVAVAVAMAAAVAVVVVAGVVAVVAVAGIRGCSFSDDAIGSFCKTIYFCSCYGRCCDYCDC
jgi:hypothetical protein